jgi:hypothetical protein
MTNSLTHKFEQALIFFLNFKHLLKENKEEKRKEKNERREGGREGGREGREGGREEREGGRKVLGCSNLLLKIRLLEDQNSLTILMMVDETIHFVKCMRREALTSFSSLYLCAT